MSTEVLDLKLELLLGSLRSSLEKYLSHCRRPFWHRSISYLEGQVLEEVSGAAGLVRLGSRTGIDPNTDGRGLGPGGVLGGNLSKQLGQNST